MGVYSVSLLSASGARPYPRGPENRRRVGACLRLHCGKNAAGSPDRETTCRVCRSAARKRERGNRVLSLAAGASDCQDSAICHNDRWQNRHDLRLAAIRSGLGPAFCRGSAMVDPADTARLRRWTNGTAVHVPPGRAGKVVVSFLLSAAGGCCSTVPPDRRQRCRFTARCQHCGGILPYGRNLYQSVCRTAHRGMALCSST